MKYRVLGKTGLKVSEVGYGTWQLANDPNCWVGADLDESLRSLAKFVELGGRLMAGVDPTGSGRTIPGYADRHVLELLVEAGFTFPQAIKICTLNAAEYLGRENEIGSIATGKRADLVLMNGDPEKEIKDVRNTEIVFKNGVGFDSKKLFESVNGKVGLY